MTIVPVLPVLTHRTCSCCRPSTAVLRVFGCVGAPQTTCRRSRGRSIDGIATHTDTSERVAQTRGNRDIDVPVQNHQVVSKEKSASDLTETKRNLAESKCTEPQIPNLGAIKNVNLPDLEEVPGVLRAPPERRRKGILRLAGPRQDDGDGIPRVSPPCFAVQHLHDSPGL